MNQEAQGKKVFHLVIPTKPADLSDEDLDAVAAGKPSWGTNEASFAFAFYNEFYYNEDAAGADVKWKF